MMKNMAILTVVTALLAGCSTTEEHPHVTPLAPVRPVTSLPGTYVEPTQLECLRYQEVAKGYSIGRFIDPVDSTVMHEQSVVYRIEEGTSWNLQSDMPVDVPFDGTPKAHVYRDERELRAEMTAKANKQREYYEGMRKAQILAMSKMEAFKKTVEQARKLAQLNTNLLGEVRAMKERNKALEETIEQQNRKLEVLIEFQKLSDDGDSRYKYLRRK